MHLVDNNPYFIDNPFLPYFITMSFKLHLQNAQLYIYLFKTDTGRALWPQACFQMQDWLQIGNGSGTAWPDTSFKRHPIHKSCVTTLPIQISKLHILLEPIIQNSAYLLCKLPCCLHYSISRHRRGVSILENDKWLPLKPFSASILFIAPDYSYRQAHSNVPPYS